MTRKAAKKPIQKRTAKSPRAFFMTRITAANRKAKAFLTRRPHRSFRLTRRRDIPTYTQLPGYWSLTLSVLKTIKKYIGAFAVFFAIYVLLLTVFVGIVQQDQYRSLTDAFQSLGSDIVGGKVDEATQTLVLFGTAITGGFTEPLTEVQQLYVIFISLFAWLSVIWFLRHQLAGKTVKVRDALYNSGAPFIVLLLISLVISIQLLPAAIGILIYTAADASGFLQGGVEAMMFASAALLLAVLSLYWLSSSIFALLLATIPGTYPFQAIRIAGDLVIGRRLTLMLRLIWLAFVILLLWTIILIPIILISGWINISWLPLVPVTMQLLTAASVIFASSYVFVLYRRMINEPA